jgi:hypothetical protein
MPRAPFLIGFVLAIPMERYYFLTESLYDGFEWMLRPGTLVFFAVLVLPIIWVLVKAIRTKLRAPSAKEIATHNAIDAEAPLKGTVWSRWTAVGAVVIFAGSLVMSSSYSPEARLLPQLIGWIGLALSILFLVNELRLWRTSKAAAARVAEGDAGGEDASSEVVPAGGPAVAAAQGGDRPAGSSSTADGADSAYDPDTGLVLTELSEEIVHPEARDPHRTRHAFLTFAWMGAFLVLVSLLGYLAASMIFVPAFLLLQARVRIKTAVIYTAAIFLFLLVLPSLVPVDLPQGLLTALI